MSHTFEQVIAEFMDEGPDCYGEDLILSNRVLYYMSKSWPVALKKDGRVYVNTTPRSNITRIPSLLAELQRLGAKTMQTTHEWIQLELQDQAAE